MFVIAKEVPNGAATQYHKAMKMELCEDGIHAVVNSYHRPEMTAISWQDTYLLPPPFSAETLAQVEALLVLPGAPFDGGTLVPDEVATLDAQKARVKARVKMNRDRAEWAGVETPHGHIDSDPDAQRKIAGAVQMFMLAGSPETVDWRMQDNTIVTLDATEMSAIGLLVGQHVSACQARKNELDAQVDAAATEEELSAINVETGWSD